MERTPRQIRLIPRWFIVACALIALVSLSAHVLNHLAVRGWLLQRLKIETGLEISAIRFHLFPRLRIEFSDLVVRDERHPGTIVRVPQGSLTLRVIPLLKKQLAVVKVIALEPRVVIRRDREGQWHVPLAGEPQPKEPGREGGFRFRWLLPDLQLTGGDILLIDEEGRETPREVRIRNVNALLDSDLLRRAADLKLTGDIDEAGSPSALTISGALSLWGLPSLSKASAAGLPSVRFEGSVTLEGFDLAPWIDASDQSASHEERSWRGDVFFQLLVMPGSAGYDAAFSRAETRMDWLVVRGEGLIQGLGTEQPVYSVTLSAMPVGLETVLQKAPAAWIPANLRSAVAEHELTGKLELVSASVSGRVDLPRAADWKGVVKLSNGGGLFGAGRPSVQNLSGTVFFDPAHVEAMNVSGDVGALQVSNGTLALSHLQVAPALDLQFTGTGKIRDFFLLLHDVGGAEAGAEALSAITDVTGDVRLSVHLAGPIAPDPHVDLVKAEITGRDFGASVPDWKLSAEHLDGTVAVTPRFIELKHLRGKVGPVRFDAQGAVELGRTPRFEDVTAEIYAEGAELMRFLTARLSVASDVLLDGPTRATVQLSGPVQSPGWKGRIDLSEAEIVVPPVIRKRRGVASSLEFEGNTVKGKRHTARHVALVLPSARVEGRADVRLRDRPDFDLHAKAGPLPLAGLLDGFSIPPGADGMLEASITVKGRGPDWRSWTPSGWVHVRRGKVTVEGVRDSLREVSLRLQAAGRDVMIERLAFKIGDSDVRIQGIVKEWASKPAPTLTLESSKLDITRLIPIDRGAEEGGGALERIRQWALSGRAEVTALVKQAQYHRLRFRTLSGHLHVGAGKAEFGQLNGETPEGNFSGRVVAALTSQRPIGIEAEMKIDGMPVHQILSIIDPETEPLRGFLSLTGMLQGTIQGTSPFLGTLNSLAPMQFRLDKGRVLHGTVLPKVLKVLNVPALLKGKVDLDHDGIPFDSVTATVTVLDGVLTSRNIVFDSPLMKVTGAGTLDLPADELDLALAVSPLGAYSDLIGKIPLFGTLLAGDRPGLSTALFEVKGPRTDPDVRYLPIKSIAKGLTGYPRLAIDVLTNVLALPGKLLSPDSP